MPMVAPCGIPQGSVLSPLLCNLFLDAFDEALLRQRFKLVRYADDFVVLATRYERALEALEVAHISLAALGLRLHPTKTQVTSFDTGFRYLGTIFSGDMTLPTVPRKTKKSPGVRSVSAYPAAPAAFGGEHRSTPAPPTAHGLTAVASALALRSAPAQRSMRLSPFAAALDQAFHSQRRTARRRIRQEAAKSREKSYLV